MVVSGSFSEWLADLKPPPIVISKSKLDKMNDAAKAELEAANNRTLIDPTKINVFSDPTREGSS